MELRTDDNKGRLCEFCGGNAKSPLQHCCCRRDFELGEESSPQWEDK